MLQKTFLHDYYSLYILEQCLNKQRSKKIGFGPSQQQKSTSINTIYNYSMSSVKEHLGYRVWVKPDGQPGIEPSRRPETPRPITTVHSRAIMRQQDPQGKGKYYQDRRIAFEDAHERWLLLYESKPLRLMNTGQKYLDFWNKGATSDSSDSDPDDEYEPSGQCHGKRFTYFRNDCPRTYKR